MIPRRLEAWDADAMADIHAKCFDKAWPATDMRTHIDRDICIGVGQPLMSFIILRSVGDQAEVLTIATDPDHRRHGLGRKILLSGQKSAKEEGAEIIFLEVAEDNAGAAHLYRTSGYQQISRRPAYYRRSSGRVAALVFRKDL